MKSTRHPNFILGIISFLVLFIGIAIRANGYQYGDYVIASAAALAGIHWIWAIIDVAGTTTVTPSQRKFWLIIVIIVPGFGSMIYYIMHYRRKKVV
jgi:hypothetical protein